MNTDTNIAGHVVSMPPSVRYGSAPAARRRTVRDHRDLCIEQLSIDVLDREDRIAELEAQLADRDARLIDSEADRRAFRELTCVGMAMLARVTYQRDRALSALYARTRAQRSAQQ